MRKAILALLSTALTLALASPASAEFGFKSAGVSFIGPNGAPSTQAGAHPFAVVNEFAMNRALLEGGTEEVPDGGAVEDLNISLPPGFAGDPAAAPRCSMADFSAEPMACPDATAVGTTDVMISFAPAPVGEEAFLTSPVYNLIPPPGMVARLGFIVLGLSVVVDVGVNTSYPYNVEAHSTNISQAALFYADSLTLWSDPGSPLHDEERGRCLSTEPGAPSSCPLPPGERKAYLVAPRSCTGPLESTFSAIAWITGKTDSIDTLTEPGMVGCSKLDFEPRITAKPTTDGAESPSGLDVAIEIDDEGYGDPGEVATAQSDLKKAVVTLPEGVTANPSLAEGLSTCSPADLARETLSSEPGEGCPSASKIGSLEVESPALQGELIRGSLFIASQDDPATSAPGAENPFDTLLALYIVIKHPQQGILVKLAGKVEPDPKTGQLTTIFGDPSAADPAYRQLPQLPFSDFRLRFREGGRSPLVTPPTCGTYATKAELIPWANPGNPKTVFSSFEITEGPGGGPCPPAGVPPFKPGFTAGSIDNNAGAHTPFYMRLTRSDGEQDMTKFSSVLPPGVLGKLAGVDKCPDSAIEAAKSRTGRQELIAPSCPANSKIGHVLAGAGVGGALTYVKGSIYLAGPYKGDPLSVAVITPAVAGPFDAGTILVREALTLNPTTAEVEVDGASSDPIPHILKGIPLKVRDIRVNVDRPNFVLNPTSCDPSSAKATLFGGFLDVFSPADDVPVDLSSPFQAANCLNLGLKPKLNLNLKGGTKRGGHPGLTATYTPRAGDANIEDLVVRLPRSAFLDQGHIRTICTRVQFAADACPKGAQYGFIRAWTPLLEEPLAGPAYLRSSSNKLPDLVFDLKGLVDVEVATRLDSVNGGIRASVEDAPDAPISKVVLKMQGQKKGLIVNSRDLCAAPSRAGVQFTGQNGKQFTAKPRMRAQCGKKRRGHRGKSGRR